MSKKYFWLQLKDDFFKKKEIKKLRKIAGGDTYTIIYLKMLLLSLKNDGKLYFDGVEDDFVEEISLEIDEETDNVKIVFLFLVKNNLIEEVSEEEYFLNAVPELIGKESDSAPRVRKYREKKKLLESEKQKALQCNNGNVTSNECNNLCNTEIEKEINIDIELEKNIDIDKNNSKSKKSKKVVDKIQYAEFVFLKQEEYEKLCKEYSEEGTKRMIEILDNYKGANGKSYKDDYRAILSWVINKFSEEVKKQNTQSYNKQSPIDILGELYQEASEREGVK